MSGVKLAALYCIAAAGFSFQQPKGSNQPQTPPESGLEAPWDARQIVADLERDNEQLNALLSKMNPQQWYAQKGAPTTYIIQWQTAQQQTKDVIVTANALSQKTETLSLALDVYFRLEALEVTARSLEQGAQRYADRATADKLSALIAHNFNNREHFRDYLRDLTTSTEQNFKIADDEAQRCRGMISKEPAQSSTKRPKKH